MRIMIGAEKPPPEASLPPAVKVPSTRLE